MSDDASQRLDELKLLWESDPSSKVYLQLASAYRQKGQIDKAIEVLETSLQHRPRDPRGRVALARCKMEKGDFAAAADLLEEVIRQDAAHLEANKQLLECYLRLGEAAKAEERLGIYKLLNDRDPELDHLEYRLQSLQGGESESSPAASAPAPQGETVAETAKDEAATTREVLMEAPTSAAPSEPPPVAETPVPPVIEPPATASPPLSSSADEEAAAEEDAPAEDEHRPIPGLPAMKFAVADSDEDAFEPPSVEAPTVEGNEEPPAVAVESAERTPVVEAPIAADPVADPGAEPAEEPTMAPAAEEPAAEESPKPEVAPPSGDDLFDLAPQATEDIEAGSDPWGGEDLFDLAPPSADVQEAVDELDGLWEQTEVVDIEDDEDDEDDETDLSEAAAVDVAEDELFATAETSDDESPSEARALAEQAEPASQAAGEKATATLGLLYLRQGHLDEAEKIFRRVLETDADNEAALAGLQQLDSQRAAMQAPDIGADPEADAAEIEPEAEPAPEPSEPEAAVVVESAESDFAMPDGDAPPLVATPHADTSDAEPVASEPEPVTTESAPPEPESAPPTSGLTVDVLLGRQALEGGVPDDVTGRKIAVLQQYIQHIRTASRDHVH